MDVEIFGLYNEFGKPWYDKPTVDICRKASVKRKVLDLLFLGKIKYAKYIVFDEINTKLYSRFMFFIENNGLDRGIK